MAQAEEHEGYLRRVSFLAAAGIHMPSDQRINRGPEWPALKCMLVILNFASRYSPILSADMVLYCHPVQKHPSMGGPRRTTVSSAPKP